ncbi:MAG: hypothetical protein WBC40_00790 [Halobacteriota archaeon]
MKLPEEDVDLFYKLHPALLFYTNQRKSVFGSVTTVEEFMQLQIEEILDKIIPARKRDFAYVFHLKREVKG